MHERAAARDDHILVPVVHLDHVAERRPIADRADQRFAARAEAFHDLSAPGEDPHRRVLGVELPGIDAARPEVGLRTRHHPVHVNGPDVGGHRSRNIGEPGQPGLAPVLEPAATIAFDLDLELQREVLGDEVAINDVAVAARVGGCGLADDRAVLDAPELRVPVPPFKAHAVEQRDVAGVIVEVEWRRFGEYHPSAGRRGGRSRQRCDRRLLRPSDC